MSCPVWRFCVILSCLFFTYSCISFFYSAGKDVLSVLLFIEYELSIGHTMHIVFYCMFSCLFCPFDYLLYWLGKDGGY